MPDIHVGDAGTAIDFVILKAADRSAEDLSLATKLEIVLLAPSKKRLVREAALKVDGKDGTIRYVSKTADFFEPGEWAVQANISVNGGSWHTDTATFIVKPNL